MKLNNPLILYTVLILSHEDHPLGVLEKDFNRVPKGTVTTVAMKLSTVIALNDN